MNRGNMGKQISSAPKSKKVKKMFGGGMATPMSPPPGVANAMAAFQRDQSQMSPAAMSSIGQQAMLRGQQMDTSGPQLGRPGSAVRPMPVKPMPGGIRGTSGPKPATALVSQPRRPVSSAVPAEMQRGGARGMAKGGKVTRADGCCMKGKTKGKMC